MRAAAQQRPEQRVAAEPAVEVGEVVVDAEGESHPLDRDLELAAVGRAPGAGRPVQIRACDRAGLERLGPEAEEAGPLLPGVDGDRSIADVKQAGGDAAGAPQDPIAPRRGQAERRRRAHLDLEPPGGGRGQGHRPSR